MGYKTINEQIETFISILKQNDDLMIILDYISSLNLPNFYIAAGSIFQTIWNYYDNKPLNFGIKDIDIIYYDPNKITKENEKELEDKIINYFEKMGLKYKLDLHNEARMHLWKKDNENKDINQYLNSEDAINQLIATIQAVGITKENYEIKVYAPYGLSDIFCKTIRPIKHKANSKELYDNKVDSWQKRFENLNIIEWENDKLDREFVKCWLNKLKDYWFNKDIDNAVSLFKKTTFYQETPYMKPYTTLDEINKEWQHVKNENIQNIEIKLLAIDGYKVIAEWILKQNDINYAGIYEIKFNERLECVCFKSWEMSDEEN